ncbi:MAG: peptide-methionine (S)-S-oxide reductase MsrA [Defluviitaleaceae bacterium]|nr:peptide-methionine (S)-S-oxide reductase MsrA [Defluviitaleaceae bacterium]
MKKGIYFAGGCFWGVQKFFDLVKGVLHTEVGFANGNTQNPTYEEVYTGTTGHAEVVYVQYDADVISLEDLLKKFYIIIDPTTLNAQGGDAGTHYRSGVFFVDPSEEGIIAASLKELAGKYSQPIVVENTPLTCYYKAEEYHQEYLEKNADGYCHLGDDYFNKA